MAQQPQLEVLRGQGIEIEMVHEPKAIQYHIWGQGIPDEANFYRSPDREALLDKLLTPLGLAERDGRIVEAAH